MVVWLRPPAPRPASKGGQEGGSEPSGCVRARAGAAVDQSRKTTQSARHSGHLLFAAFWQAGSQSPQTKIEVGGARVRASPALAGTREAGPGRGEICIVVVITD